MIFSREPTNETSRMQRICILARLLQARCAIARLLQACCYVARLLQSLLFCCVSVAAPAALLLGCCEHLCSH